MGPQRFASGRNLPRARVPYKDGSNVRQGVLDTIILREDSAVKNLHAHVRRGPLVVLPARHTRKGQ